MISSIAPSIFGARGAAVRPSQQPTSQDLPGETFSASVSEEKTIPRMTAAPAKAAAPSPGILSRIARHTATRALTFGCIGLMALALTGCNDKTDPTPAPTTTVTQPAVTANTMTQRLQDLKGSDAKGYANMAEAGYYRQLLESISKDGKAGEAVKEGKTVQQIAQEAVAAFNLKGTPESQQQAMTAALKAISDKGPGVYHDAAQAALTMGQEFNKGLANAPGGWTVQTKASLYDKALEEAVKQLPGLPATLNAQTGLSPSVISGYVDMLSLEAKSALEYSRQVNDPGMSVVLIEGTANQLYGQVQSNAQLVNTQFGAALSLLKNLKLPF